MVKLRVDSSGLAVKAQTMGMVDLHFALGNEIAAFCALSFQHDGGSAIPGERRKAKRVVARLQVFLASYLRRAGFPPRVVTGHPALVQLAGLADVLEQQSKLAEVKARHGLAREWLYPILNFLEPHSDRR